MFFVLQKIIWFLLLPLSSLLVLISIGLALMRKRPALGRGLVLFSVLVLYALSLSPTADMILKPLENRYPPMKQEILDVDAVVVPGGGSVDLRWMSEPAVPNAETLSRLVLGVQLAKQYKAPLVLTGGNGEPFATTVRDADAMAEIVHALGMQRGRVIVENESRNTVENSHAVRRLIKGDRIVLATSAYYMRRAAAVFEKRGFRVVPAPTYFLVQKRVFSLASFIPKAGDLSRSTTGIAEWISMAWWRLRGEV